MRHERFTPREDYRQQENQRANESASLSKKFPELKSLTVEYGYFSQEGVRPYQRIKFTVNTDHAKSVFRLDCVNADCVRGDFDLSEALARVVAAHQTTASGEMCCQGWLNKNTIERIHCHHVLRYKLSLEYALSPAVDDVQLQGA